jgi:hypothetical protein
MAHARRLMDKHGLTMGDVDAFRTDAAKAASETFTKAEAKNVYAERELAMFKRVLAQSVQELTDTYFHTRYTSEWNTAKSKYEMKQHVNFVGEELDVAVAVATFRMLMKSCVRIARDVYGQKWGVSHTSFVEGFAQGVSDKVAEMKRSSETQFDGTADAETFTLMRVSKKQWLQSILIEAGLITDPAIIAARIKRWEEERLANPPAPVVEPSKPVKAKKVRERKGRTRKFDWSAFDRGHETGRSTDTTIGDKLAG